MICTVGNFVYTGLSGVATGVVLGVALSVATFWFFKRKK